MAWVSCLVTHHVIVTKTRNIYQRSARVCWADNNEQCHVRTSACDDSTQLHQAGSTSTSYIYHIWTCSPPRLTTTFLLQLSPCLVQCQCHHVSTDMCCDQECLFVPMAPAQSQSENNWLQIFLLRLQPTTGHGETQAGTLNFTFMLDICGQIRY